jgi:hypothetical protein
MGLSRLFIGFQACLLPRDSSSVFPAEWITTASVVGWALVVLATFMCANDDLESACIVLRVVSNVLRADKHAMEAKMTAINVDTSINAAWL